MNAEKTYYEILGVRETDGLAEVKKQYHRLVRKYHPDIAKDADTAHEHFILINEAYKTLKDPILRKAYDFGLREKRGAEPSITTTVHRNVVSEADRRKAEANYKMNRDKAFAMLSAGKLSEALLVADSAIAFDSSHADIWELKGDIHRKIRNTDLAMQAYSKALQLDPSNTALKAKLMDTVAERNGKSKNTASGSDKTKPKSKKGFWGKLFS